MGINHSNKNIEESSDLSADLQSGEKYEHLYKKMRLMCDNVPDLIWSKDLERRFTFTNKEICRKILLIDDVDAAIGETSEYFIQRIKAEKPEYSDWYTIGDLSRNSDDFVYQFQRQIQVVISGYIRGKFYEIELQKAPFFDDTGKFIGLVGSGRDVTRRRVLERETRFDQERMQLAMDGANLGVWDWQMDKGKLIIDRRWVNLLGISSEKFDNNYSLFKRYIHPDDITEYDEKLRKHFLNETSSFEHTFRLKTKDALKYRWFKSVGTVVEFDIEEKPKRMVGIHQDVTKDVAKDVELKDALVRAEESDKLKTAFLANLSHEIRTPLNSILGFTRYLVFEDNISFENKNEYMDIIDSSSECFLQLINNIIDIAKIESGVFRVKKERFDLKQLCSDTTRKLKRVSHYSDKINIRFTPEPEDQSLYIYSDKNVLDQVISSLLSNAIKFTMEGEVELGYELIDSDRLFLFVKDSGIGIDLKHENVIYQPFRQLTESFKREYGGAGLGLAIAYSMTEILNGKLWFESEKGRGTIFYVYIPLAE